eukprot:925055-Pyramimonas_sp.AAC.1
MACLGGSRPPPFYYEIWSRFMRRWRAGDAGEGVPGSIVRRLRTRDRRGSTEGHAAARGPDEIQPGTIGAAMGS